MNLRRKFIFLFLGILIFSLATSSLWRRFLNNSISEYTTGKLKGIEGLAGIKSTPVFQSGLFSEDGKYFVYTYRPEVERPDVDGSVTMRGFAYPTYFQVIDCANGKKKLPQPVESGKYDQMYVLWVQDDWVWLMKRENKKGNFLALYDLKDNQFRFDFGALEKLNPNISWKESNRFLRNTTTQKGLIVEANDKRNYLIDPETGKVSANQGKFSSLDMADEQNYQVSDLDIHPIFRKEQLNGSRTSIINTKNKATSEDDFIEVKYLTLSKNREVDYEAPITFYKNYFFVLSPVTADDDVNMELAMIDKNTLKTAWKLQLPQDKLKTFTPHYGFERFFIKGDQLWVSNNNYLMTIDLSSGKILKQENLYE